MASMDNLYRLLNIMKTLRDPERGCLWDQQQTFASIVPYTIEEVYEVADSIDQQDYSQLKNELGDLLLQIVYYTQMAREQNLFNFDDVAKSISDKLVRRHPQVFDDQHNAKVADWEELKQTERAEKSQYENNSLLSDIPMVMPQLLRAKKIQKCVATVGFDWQEVKEVLHKVEEELVEVKEVMNAQDQASELKQARLEEELGDLLFSVVNLSRHLKVDAEEALRKGNGKFIRRFEHLENKLAAQGKELKKCDLEEMETAWENAKLEVG